MNDEELLALYSPKGTQLKCNTPKSSDERKQNSELKRGYRKNLFSPRDAKAPNIPSKYEDRKTKGEIVCQFGDYAPIQTLKPCEITLSTTSTLTAVLDYMFQTPYDVIMAFSTRIDFLADLVVETYPKEEIIWTSVDCLTGTDPVYIYGMVTTIEDNRRLTSSSILLQGTWSNSAGKIVSLDLSAIENYSVFPGQFLALRGLNPSGKTFIADRLFVLPFPSKPNRALNVGCSKTPSKQAGLSEHCGFSVVCAAGPFTTCENLDFGPLQDLVRDVAQTDPDILILIGPFLPAKHRTVDERKVLRNFNSVFDQLINSFVVEPLKSCKCKIILVSSAKDVFHHPVYPTPPYNTKKITEKLTMVSDPGAFKVNGINFRVTSTDIIFHLSKEEISNEEGNRMQRLVNHLFTQRNMYPLYPPNEEMSIDYTRFNEFCNLNELPDIVIMPSCLRQFAQGFRTVSCINPGFLSKGEVGGTFCRLSVRTNSDGNRGSAKKVSDFVTAEIRKV